MKQYIYDIIAAIIIIIFLAFFAFKFAQWGLTIYPDPEIELYL